MYNFTWLYRTCRCLYLLLTQQSVNCVVTARSATERLLSDDNGPEVWIMQFLCVAWCASLIWKLALHLVFLKLKWIKKHNRPVNVPILDNSGLCFALKGCNPSNKNHHWLWTLLAKKSVSSFLVKGCLNSSVWLISSL